MLIMKKIILLSFLCLLCTLGFSQTNDITVFSENGEEFTLYINSVKQNDPPAANVKVRNITGETYQFRLLFADNSIPELKGRYWTEAKNVEITMMAKQNKGKWNLAFRGESQRVFEEHNHYPTHHQTYVVPVDNNMPTGSISMNINDGGENVNINMSVSETSMGIQAGAGYESVNLNMNISTNATTTTSTMYGQYPPTTYRCPQPMSIYDFKDAQNSIQSTSFEDSKITLVKQICKGSCVTSEQLREFLKMFTYEVSRIEIAKHAYDFVFDPERYYIINEAFQFSSSIDELNQYIENR